jgi:SAM-dependent methyltransferase
MELTSRKYWQSYYEESAEDRETIIKVCSNYDFFWDKLVDSCDQPPKSILEIGAFPGRYLAYLSSRYGLQATGLDFNPDDKKFMRSMHAMGIETANYICSDFLTHESHDKFDLVFSNGLIEHFTNFDEVLDKHCQYLKPGGAMLIMIPNKRFIRSLYGNLVDRKNQKAHNLACMNKAVFESFALRNNLKIEWLQYHGGFPYKVHAPLNVVQKSVYHLARFLALQFNRWIKKHPSKWWSSALIGIYRKPA